MISLILDAENDIIQLVASKNRNLFETLLLCYAVALLLALLLNVLQQLSVWKLNFIEDFLAYFLGHHKVTRVKAKQLICDVSDTAWE